MQCSLYYSFTLHLEYFSAFFSPSSCSVWCSFSNSFTVQLHSLVLSPLSLSLNLLCFFRCHCTRVYFWAYKLPILKFVSFTAGGLKRTNFIVSVSCFYFVLRFIATNAHLIILRTALLRLCWQFLWSSCAFSFQIQLLQTIFVDVARMQTYTPHYMHGHQHPLACIKLREHSNLCVLENGFGEFVEPRAFTSNFDFWVHISSYFVALQRSIRFCG